MKEDKYIGNISVFGIKNTDRTELMKEIAYSMATDTLTNYRVIVLGSRKEYNSIFKLPYTNENKIRFEILDVEDIDYSYLKKRILKDKSPTVLCVDNINAYIEEYTKDMYEQDNKATKLIDFIHYISEIGRAIGGYTIIGGEDISEALKFEPTRKIILNSKKKFFLKQKSEYIEEITNNIKLSEEQISKIKKLKNKETLLLS